MKYEIEDVKWFSGKDTVGAVLIFREDETQGAYIGPAAGSTPTADSQEIVDYGAFLPYPIAKAMFPQIGPETGYHSA